jgi:hypothetical protein
MEPKVFVKNFWKNCLEEVKLSAMIATPLRYELFLSILSCIHLPPEKGSGKISSIF